MADDLSLEEDSSFDDSEGPLDKDESGLEGFDGGILDLPDDKLDKMTPEQIAELSVKEAKPAKKPEAEADEGKPTSVGLPEESGEDPKAELTDGEKSEKEKADAEESARGLLNSEDEGAPEVRAESESAETADKEKAAAGDKSPAKKTDSKAEKAKPDGNVDYKQEYEKLLAPFKANGRDIQVDTVDDAITLMRMGANYNKKMAALKPNLKIVKMLEQNDLLDEEKIGHLIDLSKHDPGAVAKLLKDAKVDPLDIDTENIDYKPANHQVNDAQFELDQVIDDIKDSPSFPRTIDVISNQWDKQSKDIVLNDPRIITVINDHVESGIFDQIVSVMDRERMLGNLEGTPDIVAYKAIGETLTQQGKFKSNGATSPQEATKPTEEDTAAAEEREAKRTAAASTKSSQSTKSNSEDFDPLSMPDEEFSKMTVPGLYR